MSANVVVCCSGYLRLHAVFFKPVNYQEVAREFWDFYNRLISFTSGSGGGGCLLGTEEALSIGKWWLLLVWVESN